ncbi:MAG: DUF2934 domain-containing protein [Candidatus Omnitrophica bacterium]|nr:DUF2934 domain-containing protein [Candidatus Omnitrophota bacterium]
MVKKVFQAAQQITEAAKKIVSGNVSRPTVSQDEFFRRVQDRAYEIFVNRGCVHGNELNDWYEAEKIVRAEIKAGR